MRESNFKPVIKRKDKGAKSLSALLKSLEKDSKPKKKRKKSEKSLVKEDGTPRKLKLGR
jgi:hypothetical protein